MVKRCLLRWGAVSFKKCCQILSEGAECVVGKEDRVGDGYIGVYVVQPVETGEREGSS
jgi:hypothetical protein